MLATLRIPAGPGLRVGDDGPEMVRTAAADSVRCNACPARCGVAGVAYECARLARLPEEDTVSKRHGALRMSRSAPELGRCGVGLVASSGSPLSDPERSSSNCVAPWKDCAKLDAGAGDAAEPHGLTGACAMPGVLGELAGGGVAGQRSGGDAFSSSCGASRVREFSLASRFPPELVRRLRSESERSCSKRPKSSASWKERVAFLRTGDATADSPLEPEAEPDRETVSEPSSLLTRLLASTGADGWRVIPGRERAGDVKVVRENSLVASFPYAEGRTAPHCAEPHRVGLERGGELSASVLRRRCRPIVNAAPSDAAAGR